jgi:hypothetical protein
VFAANGAKPGGIDVDQGGALCVQKGPDVELTLSKRVRFTNPSDYDALASVLVKGVMDFLLLTAGESN